MPRRTLLIGAPTLGIGSQRDDVNAPRWTHANFFSSRGLTSWRPTAPGGGPHTSLRSRLSRSPRYVPLYRVRSSHQAKSPTSRACRAVGVRLDFYLFTLTSPVPRWLRHACLADYIPRAGPVRRPNYFAMDRTAALGDFSSGQLWGWRRRPDVPFRFQTNPARHKHQTAISLGIGGIPRGRAAHNVGARGARTKSSPAHFNESYHAQRGCARSPRAQEPPRFTKTIDGGSTSRQARTTTLHSARRPFRSCQGLFRRNAAEFMYEVNDPGLQPARRPRVRRPQRKRSRFFRP